MKIIMGKGLEAELVKAFWDQNNHEEQCGVLVGTCDMTNYVVKVTGFLRMPNRAEDPRTSFRINKSDLPENFVGNIVGAVHTHPEPLPPSRKDFDGLTQEQIGILINPNGVTYYTSDGRYPMELNDVPLTPKTPVDVTEFYVGDHKYVVNISWLMSNWACMFNETGCHGAVTSEMVHDGKTNRAIGCCTGGTYLVEPEDIARTTEMVALLTEEEVTDPKMLAQIKAGDWFYKAGKDGSIHTRVPNGGCIFANRGEAGKVGCAFHHLGQRLGKTHVQVMPETCWSVPFAVEDVKGVTYIRPWDKEHINLVERDPEDYRSMGWWCVVAPDAYTGEDMIYRSMEEELRTLIGDAAYDALDKIIRDKVAQGFRPLPMPGVVRNEGRPMIPLFVNNKNASA